MTAVTQRPASPRRTQVERSQDTRQRLCQAALDLLVEVGYDGLTTAQIAQRAQVSKGAQTYHYASKEDMLVAAFEHLLARWGIWLQDYLDRIDGTPSVEGIMQEMWQQVFARPDYLASLEVMLAARHNPALRLRLRQLLKGWGEERDRSLAALLPQVEPREMTTFLQLSYSVLRGVALFDGLAEDEGLQQRMLQLWIRMATEHTQAGAAPTDARPGA